MKIKLTLNGFWLGVRYCRYAHVLHVSVIPFLVIQVTLPGCVPVTNCFGEGDQPAYWEARQ